MEVTEELGPLFEMAKKNNDYETVCGVRDRLRQAIAGLYNTFRKAALAPQVYAAGASTLFCHQPPAYKTCLCGLTAAGRLLLTGVHKSADRPAALLAPAVCSFVSSIQPACTMCLSCNWHVKQSHLPWRGSDTLPEALTAK